MPARKSRPAQDHTSLSLFSRSEVAETPDGQPARIYSNQGAGLSAVSGKNYNEARGRRGNAPTKGGPREEAYKSLLRPGKATD